MTEAQRIVTIGLAALATLATRFLPFLVFSDRRPTPAWVKYLGRALPSASFAMLIIYSLRQTEWTTGSHGLPEILAIAVTGALYLWRRQMILPVAGGTLTYMLLVQYVF